GYHPDIRRRRQRRRPPPPPASPRQEGTRGTSPYDRAGRERPEDHDAHARAAPRAAAGLEAGEARDLERLDRRRRRARAARAARVGEEARRALPRARGALMLHDAPARCAPRAPARSADGADVDVERARVAIAGV